MHVKDEQIAAALLTVGYPTFNRRSTVIKTVEQNFQSAPNLACDIVVSDNGTVDLEEKDFAHFPKVKVYKFERNMGFLENILELIRRCESEYLMFCSDEDLIAAENLTQLEEFLRSYQPLAVSSPFRDNQRIRRKNNPSWGLCSEILFRKAPPIPPEQLRQSFGYMSGTVFQAKFAKSCVKFLEHYRENSMVDLYPIVVLAELARVQQPEKILWFNQELARGNFNLPTEIDPEDSPYWFVSQRISQFKDFQNLLVAILQNQSDREARRRIEIENRQISKMLRNSVELELSRDLPHPLRFLKLKDFIPKWKRS